MMDVSSCSVGHQARMSQVFVALLHVPLLGPFPPTGMWPSGQSASLVQWETSGLLGRVVRGMEEWRDGGRGKVVIGW